jgi:hypothetical protein
LLSFFGVTRLLNKRSTLASHNLTCWACTWRCLKRMKRYVCTFVERKIKGAVINTKVFHSTILYKNNMNGLCSYIARAIIIKRKAMLANDDSTRVYDVLVYSTTTTLTSVQFVCVLVLPLLWFIYAMLIYRDACQIN